MPKTTRKAGVGVLVGMLMLPSVAAAQRGVAEIAGVVEDGTGGVLPGVTVEVTSPGLIEGVRTVVTEANGAYRVVNLGPGIYTATFSLSGFSTVQREGIELTANFTATIGVVMSVGELSETVVVTGATPVVDIRNVIQQVVLTRQVIEAIPTGKYFNNYGTLMPGMSTYSGVSNTTQDVGGTLGSIAGFMTIHGSAWNDQQFKVDGMSVNSLDNSGTGHYIPTDVIVEEFNFVTGAKPAEWETGGVQVNIVPKAGSNIHSGSFYSSFANESTQAENLDDELIGAGLAVSNQLVRQYDFAPSLGGPIARDKLWFYSGGRYYLNDRLAGGIFFNKDPKALVYEPDTSRPGVKDNITDDYSIRLTWQAAEKHKLSAFYNYNHICDCHRNISPQTAPEASFFLNFYNNIVQANWTMPATNRLLVDAGFTVYQVTSAEYSRQDEATEIAIVEQSNNLNYRSRARGSFANPGHNWNGRFALSYITGSHSLKVGWQGAWFYRNNNFRGAIDDLSYRFLNGVPNRVTYNATPWETKVDVAPQGFYAQDQWTVDKLTITGGLRFDWLTNGYRDIDLPAATYMVARSFEGADVSSMTDLSPRLSVAYDLFGDGRTALKANVSRYVGQVGAPFTDPISASNNTSNRTWTDNNGDFVVQGDPFLLEANGELGPQTNVNFGQTVITRRIDPDIERGFGIRPYNWEYAAGIQQEVVPGVSLSAMFFRRHYGNFHVTDNLAVESSDFTPYCFNMPLDSRLPGGGGGEVCNQDVNPDKRGQFDRFLTSASNYGDQERSWRGLDMTVNARLDNGVTLQGGLSTGKHINDACDIANNYPYGKVAWTSDLEDHNGSTGRRNPTKSLTFCRNETAWRTQLKFLGSAPLPWDVQMGIALQNTEGRPMDANFVATNALIAPSLGRNLSAGSTATVTMNGIHPESVYLDRVTQLDLRFNKTFPIGGARLKAGIDFYNTLNANTVVTSNATYGTDGSAWLRPEAILSGRIIRFSTQVDF